MAGQPVQRAWTWVHVRIAAPRRRAVQHPEGAVLLVADSAAQRRRRRSWRPAGRGRSSCRPSCVFAIQTCLIASWWDWQFGASLVIAASPTASRFAAALLAACFDWAAAPRRRARRSSLGVAAALVAAVDRADGPVLDRSAADGGHDLGAVHAICSCGSDDARTPDHRPRARRAGRGARLSARSALVGGVTSGMRPWEYSDPPDGSFAGPPAARRSSSPATPRP